MQDIVVAKIPTLLSQIGELHSQLEMQSSGSSSTKSLAVGALVLDGMIRATLTDIERDLKASYRGGSGAQLRKALDANVETMVSAWKSYLDTVKASSASANDASTLDRSYASAVHSAIDTWSVSLVELKRLLNARLSYLLGKLRSSLLLNGLLVAFSLAFAVVTGRHIVQPLLKLEGIADQVGQTQNYRLRADYESRDEIGRLAAAFNAMLAELAAAREREAIDAAAPGGNANRARQSGEDYDHGRDGGIHRARDQPASCGNCEQRNASFRWLAQDPPNVKRARSVLERVVSDGARASEVIGSIRSMLGKSGQERSQLDVNDLIREVMTFARADLRRHGISARTELAEDLPQHLRGTHSATASPFELGRERRRIHGSGRGWCADANHPFPKDGRLWHTCRCRRYRHRHCSDGFRANLRGVLFHEARGHGYGTFHLPLDRRGARWPHHGITS